MALPGGYEVAVGCHTQARHLQRPPAGNALRLDIRHDVPTSSGRSSQARRSCRRGLLAPSHQQLEPLQFARFLVPASPRPCRLPHRASSRTPTREIVGCFSVIPESLMESPARAGSHGLTSALLALSLGIHMKRAPGGGAPPLHRRRCRWKRKECAVLYAFGGPGSVRTGRPPPGHRPRRRPERARRGACRPSGHRLVDYLRREPAR